MLDATAIFLRAQQAWAERAVPPYESFRVPCEQTFLGKRCERGDVVAFTVRMSDGRTYAEALPGQGGTPRTLLRGAFITGPAGTPLGFYRVLPSGGATPGPAPPNLAPDPLQTIATVTANSHAYDIALAGEESVGGRACYHLILRPLGDRDRFPLRDLWVDETAFEVAQLTYERPYDERNTRASVIYRFAPVGEARVWTIVHIEATAIVPGFLAKTSESVSDDLRDITFPATAPTWYFESDPSAGPAGSRGLDP